MGPVIESQVEPQQVPGKTLTSLRWCTSKSQAKHQQIQTRLAGGLMSPTLCRCVLCLLGSALMCQVCNPATASVSGLLIHLEFFNFSAMFLCWKLCHICYAFGFVGIPYSKCFLYGLSAHCSPSALLARVKYFMVLLECASVWKVSVTQLLVSAWALMHSSWLQRL